jgi:5-methyltetrahydrofolate--homocysteine methyltransferase
MSAVDELHELLGRRIVVLDGAMGTMVQGLGLADEAVWRGERFKNHTHSLKGCNDLLALTRPEAIEEIHYQFLRAGADIVETDTFTATSLALADYGLEGAVRDINLAAAQAARRACARWQPTASAGGSRARSARPRSRRPCRPMSTIRARAR